MLFVFVRRDFKSTVSGKYQNVTDPSLKTNKLINCLPSFPQHQVKDRVSKKIQRKKMKTRMMTPFSKSLLVKYVKVLFIQTLCTLAQASGTVESLHESWAISVVVFLSSLKSASRPANIPVWPEFHPGDGKKKIWFPGSLVKIPVSCPLLEIFLRPNSFFIITFFLWIVLNIFFSYSFLMWYRTCSQYWSYHINMSSSWAGCVQ